MKVLVEAGALATVGNMLKKFGRFLGGLFDKFADMGIEVTDARENEDGSVDYVLTINGKKCELSMDPVDGKDGYFDITFSIMGAGNETIRNVKESDIERKISELLNNQHNVKFGRVEKTKKLSVTLHKVMGSEGESIEMSKVYATYDPVEAMGDLYNVLGDEAFVDLITEEPQSFDITDDGDEYDVEPTEGVENSGAFIACLNAATIAYNNIKTIHWNAKGEDFFELHRVADDYSNHLHWEIDNLGELCAEMAGFAPNPGQIDQGALVPAADVTTSDEAYRIISENLQQYIDCLETYYVNFSHDVQSKIDDYLRHWTSEVNYRLKRQQPD